MSGQHSTRRGPLNFCAGRIYNGSANHGVMRPLWTYENGAYYEGDNNVVMAAFAVAAIPALASPDSFSLHAMPANSVSVSSSNPALFASEDNIRVLSAVRDENNYIDAILRADNYEIWSGVPNDNADLATCAFPIASYVNAEAPLIGEFLTFELGYTVDGIRSVLASSKVPRTFSSNAWAWWSNFPFNESDLTVTVLPVHGTTRLSVFAMLRVARQLAFSPTEQQASTHHWLTAEVETASLGAFCGIGKPFSGATFYTDVLFRSITTPKLIPLRNDYQHDADHFGGVFQPKILLSGASADQMAIVTRDADAQMPDDMLPSHFEFKSRSGSGSTAFPNGLGALRQGRSDNSTRNGGIKAVLTPGTAISQSLLVPPADGVPSWSNIAQSQESLTVNIAIQGGDFNQWLPSSVVCQLTQEGNPHAATDCVYVGTFPSHSSSRPLDQSLYADSNQVMTTNGSVAVIVSPSYGNQLYWDGSKWTQRYRYSALFIVRITYQYFQSTHQPVVGSVTVGSQGVSVIQAAIKWPSAGFVLNSGQSLFTPDLPASGLIPPGEQNADIAFRGSRLDFLFGQWQLMQDSFYRISPPPGCSVPQVSLQ